MSLCDRVDEGDRRVIADINLDRCTKLAIEIGVDYVLPRRQRRDELGGRHRHHPVQDFQKLLRGQTRSAVLALVAMSSYSRESTTVDRVALTRSCARTVSSTRSKCAMSDARMSSRASASPVTV